MTEEIIIDGVDVAGCEFLQDGICYAQKDNQDYTDIECRYDNYNCYFKQLKRLQAENEQLNVKNEQLHQTYLKLCDETKELDYWKEHDRIRQEENYNLSMENYSYKQALEEIREIEKYRYHVNSSRPMSQIKFMEKIILGYESRRFKILNKVDEVLK